MHRKTAQWFDLDLTAAQRAILVPEAIVPLPPMPRGRPRMQDWAPGLRLPRPLPEPVERPAEESEHWWFQRPAGVRGFQ